MSPPNEQSDYPSTQVPEPIGEEDYDDTDSAFDSESFMTDATSLSSSVTRYREENGRRYHAYGSTEHWGPNDERAQDQQDLSHHLWSLTLKGKLFLAPVENPQNILELGTSTGIWAIDVAEEHPQAQVTGTDLSPIQPSWVPPNLKFIVDDYNVEWLDVDKYDLIHSRELLGTVPDWPEMYRKAYTALKPGGWLEHVEPSIFLVSDYDTLDDDHVYHKWGELMKQAGIKAGMEFHIGDRIKGWMEDAGFTNVTERRVPWPIGGWAKDKHNREIGLFNQARLGEGVMDFCSRRFANNLGWAPDELEVFGANMRSAIKNPRLLAHQWVYFVYGQKPAKG